MKLGGKAGLAGVAALASVFLLPGPVRAEESRIYAVERTRLERITHITLEMSYGGAILDRATGPAPSARIGPWEVSVRVDAKRSRIECVYRRAVACSRELGSELWLPPAAVIRVYAGLALQPDTALVDPAGVAGHGAASGAANRPTGSDAVLPRPHGPVPGMSARTRRIADPPAFAAYSRVDADTPSAIAAPLRI